MLTVNDLPIGSKIRFGAYSVEGEDAHSISWLKVHTDANGRCVLLSEYIEDLRAFDAREPRNRNNRNDYGNNRYSVSNIEQFLNGYEDWFSKRHDKDRAPTEDLVYSETDYAAHRGFLSDFNPAEIDAIEMSEVKVAIPTCDIKDGVEDETILAKIFLPSKFNITGRTENGIEEGEHWDYFRNGNDSTRLAKLSLAAYENTNSNEKPENADDNWYWLLRSAYSGNGCGVRCVNRGGGLGGYYAYTGYLGIRPALKMNPTIIISDLPDDEGYYSVISDEPVIVEIGEDELLKILGI